MSAREYEQKETELLKRFRNLLRQAFVNGLEKDEVLARGKKVVDALEAGLYGEVEVGPV